MTLRNTFGLGCLATVLSACLDDPRPAISGSIEIEQSVERSDYATLELAAYNWFRSSPTLRVSVPLAEVDTRHEYDLISDDLSASVLVIAWLAHAPGVPAPLFDEPFGKAVAELVAVPHLPPFAAGVDIVIAPRVNAADEADARGADR